MTLQEAEKIILSNVIRRSPTSGAETLWRVFVKSDFAKDNLRGYVPSNGIKGVSSIAPGWLRRTLMSKSLEQSLYPCSYRSNHTHNAVVFARWLSGEGRDATMDQKPAESPGSPRLLALESQVSDLRRIVDNLCFQLGVKP